MDSSRKFLRTICLVQDVVRQGFQVCQMSANNICQHHVTKETDAAAYLRRAPRNRLKSECFGLSTSTIPHGYILARTSCPSISTSSSEPMIEKGIMACTTRCKMPFRMKHDEYYAREARCCPEWYPHRPPQCHKGNCRRECHSTRYLP